MANKRIDVTLGLSYDKTGLNSLQNELQRISASVKAMNPNNLTQGLKQAGQTAEQLDKILEKTFNSDLGTLNVTKFNQELAKSGMTLKSIKTDLSNYGNAGATAYNRMAQAILGTNVQLKQSNKLLDSMATTMMNTVKWGITSSIFNTITRSISKAYGYVKDLDSSLNDIRIVTGKSAEEMEIFAEKANNAAKALGASTLDYSKASLIYYQQGLSDQEVQARAETTVKVANVTGQTGEAVSQELTAVWNGYKVSAEEAEMYVDKLAAVAATTASNLEELSTGMSKVASAANAMGVDFDDLNAQIATIVSVTRQAPESVGTALKTIYARLGDLKVDGIDEFGVKLGEVSGQLKTMGIEILDQNGNMRDMTSVMTEVAEKWNTWTRAQQQAAAVAMAGKRQYNNLIALFENWDMYSKALETSVNSLGTLQNQQDIYMESTAAKLKELKATWQGLYQDLLYSKDVNKGIDLLTEVVDGVDKVIKGFGGGSKAIVAFGAIFANIFNKQISNAIIQGNENLNRYKNNLAIIETKLKVIEADAAKVNGARKFASEVEAEANTRAQMNVASKLLKAGGGLTDEQGNQGIQLQQQIGALEGQIAKIEFQAGKVKLNIEDWGNNLQKVVQKAQESGQRIQGVNQGAQGVLETLTKKEDILKLGTSELQTIVEETDRLLAIEEKRLIPIQKSYEIKKLEITAAKTQKDVEKQIEILRKELTQEEKNSLSVTDNITVKKQILKGVVDRLFKKEKETADALKEERQALEILLGLREQNIDATSKLTSKQAELNYLLEEAKKNLNITKIVQSFSGVASSAAMLITSINNLKEAWSADSDASIGDRIRQTLMSIGFLLPGIMNMVKSLPQVFSLAVNSASALTNVIEGTSGAFNTLKNATDSYRFSASASNIASKIANELRAKGNLTESEQALLTELTSKNITRKQKALRGLNVEQLKNIGITEENTTVVLAYNSAVEGTIAALSTVAIVAAAAALVVMGGIYLSTKLKEKKIEELNATRKQIEATYEENKAKQEEIDKNIELYTSYLDLAKEYEKGIATKADMASKTEELTDILNKEAIAVAELTGNYDYLTKKVKEVREERLKEKITLGIQYETETLPQEYKNLKKNKVNTKNWISDLDKVVLSDLEYFSATDYDSAIKINQDIENIDISKIIAERSKILNDSMASDSLKEAVNRLYLESGLADIANKYYSNLSDYKESQSKLDISHLLDNESINSYDDYLATINKVEGILKTNPYYNEKTKLLNDKSAADIMADLTNENKEYYNRFLATQELINNYKEANKELDDDILEENTKKLEKALNNLSNTDLQKVATKLDVEVDINNIEDAIKLAQQDIDREDLNVVASLRTKVSSDKKLSKTELKEALGEQEILTQEYETAFNDWDNQSRLDQVEILNDVVRDKIKINNEYVENIKETAAIELEIEKDKKEKYEKLYNEEEKNKLESRRNGNDKDSSIPWTQKDEERYQNLLKYKEALELAEQEYEYWQQVSEEGLAYEDLNEITFNNLISGIDGIISETQILVDLVAKVGENWTIAGKDIQEFALNFPEVLAAQENFNYLQDGSIQLTAAGKKALEDSLSTYATKLQLENKAYQEELQRQADIQIATAEMYEAQADALNDYLDNHHDATKLQADLEQNYSDYHNKLIDKTGMKQEELNEYMRKVGFITAQEEIKNQDNIFDGWVAVGEIAAKAAMAGSTGEFNANEVIKPSGKQAGGKNYKSVEKYSSKVKDVGAFEGYSDQDLAKMRDDLLKKAAAARNEAAIYISKKVGAGVNFEAMLNGMNNAISGAGNNSSSGKSKEKKEKEIDEEFDRYWEYKKAIDMLDKTLSRLEKTQSKLHGKELIKSLKEENQLLEKQKANYEALLQAQERQAGELQGQLATYGAIFQDNGELANYADLTSNMLEQYANATQLYNAGLITEAEHKIYEQQYEDFKKALSKYDSLYYSEMQDTIDKLDDARRKQLENNLKAWETEIQIKLDLTQAERDWNAFIRDVEQDFRKIYKDLVIESVYDTKDFNTYVTDLNTTLQAIHDVENEIDKLMAGGVSDMFESVSDAQEKLKDLEGEMLNQGKELYSLYQSVWDNYIDKLDQAASNLKDINEEFEHITKELEYEKKLVELIYGDKAYAKMDKFYTTQQKNIVMQIDSLKKQKEFWEAQFEAAYQMNKDTHNVILNDMSTWTEDMRKAYDEMITSQESLNDKITEGIENLTDKYLNKLADIFDKLDKNIWGNSLDKIKDDWDRATQAADEYLKASDGIYEAQSLMNDITKSINNTSNLKLQQKLKDFRDNEVESLKTKENLTEKDIELAELRYQIMLKEAALEDAQNAKTSMKLTRNTSGNWTYQYVADEDDVVQKQQDLLESYHNLQVAGDEGYRHNLDLSMQLYEEYTKKLQELAEKRNQISEEEYNQELATLNDYYLPAMQAATSNAELYRQESIAATGAVFAEVCRQNEDSYENLTIEQKTMVDGIKKNHINNYEEIRKAIVEKDYPEIAETATETFDNSDKISQSAAASIIEQWDKDNGESVKGAINDALKSIDSNTEEFEKEMNHMQEVAGIDFTALDGMINTTSGKIDTMGDKTEEMVKKSTPALETMRIMVEDLGIQFDLVTDSIRRTHEEMSQYKEAIGYAAEAMRNLNIQMQAYNQLASQNPSGGSKIIKTDFDDFDDNKEENKYTGSYDLISDPNGAKQTIGLRDENGKYFTIAEYGDEYYSQFKQVDKIKDYSNREYYLHKIIEEIIKKMGLDIDSSQINFRTLSSDFTINSTFATGGYTGEWDTSGRLAILHQKELVLNQDDTENFLKATNLLRDISKINGNIEDSIMTSILNMMSTLSPKVAGFNMDNKSSEVGGNVFNITAEFPNANDVSSIKEAILSLPNIASQYVGQST